MYQIVELAESYLSIISSLDYEVLFEGPPEPTSHDEFKWIQRIKGYPAELVRFNRKHLLCADGFFREPSRAIQEYLIDLGLISPFSDCCTNIPWRFFKSQHVHVRPFDMRVKRILQSFEENGISKSHAFKSFRRWNGRGAPDITDFGPELQCVEVKFLGDSVGREQRRIHSILRGLGIKTVVLELKDTDKSKDEYVQWRSKMRKDASKQLADLWRTPQGKKVLRFINFHLNIDAYEFRSRPADLVRFLCKCTQDALPNCPVMFSETEIAEISKTIFKSGTLKWWIVPIALCPWVAHGPSDPNFLRLLRTAHDWEVSQRTKFWNGTPDLDHFRKNLGYRSGPTMMAFDCEKLQELYIAAKRRSNLARTKFFHRNFGFIGNLQTKFHYRDNED